jgi:hypothetical protein
MRLLIRTLELVTASALLTWLWVEGGIQIYARLVAGVANPAASALGLSTPLDLGLVDEHFLSFVPFLALMLVTPGLSARRRGLGTLAGLACILLAHAACALLAGFAVGDHGRGPEGIAVYYPALVLSDGLPFALWAILARETLGELVSTTLQGTLRRAHRNQ